MKQILLLIIFAGILSFSAHSQSTKERNKDTSEGSEYIPVEGRNTAGVPKELQGTWVLSSGLKKLAPVVNTKKPTPGTETHRDSVTSTTIINGETHTRTEVDIQRIAPSANRITPTQKDNMHRAEKPSISFYGVNETFSGFTGCNKYSGRFKTTGNKIILLVGAASTKMVCMGEYDENEFLKTLKKVNGYRSKNGQLELIDGNDVLLVFERK